MTKVKKCRADTCLYDLHCTKQVSREEIRLRDGADPAPNKMLKTEAKAGIQKIPTVEVGSTATQTSPRDAQADPGMPKADTANSSLGAGKGRRGQGSGGSRP